MESHGGADMGYKSIKSIKNLKLRRVRFFFFFEEDLFGFCCLELSRF